MAIYQNLSIEEAKKLHLRELLKEYIESLDSNLKYFCKLIRQDLREERDHVIAITGYPGLGKSQLAAVAAMCIDFDYSFGKNVCFIPTSKDIENMYMGLPMYSVLHIDEASRGIHKHKWHDKMQQKLNELYDTDREGHFLCTLLLMPRFQNFTENFRNFRIKYWINITDRGIALVYKRDEDKDCKDPWHLDENYKLKLKRWGNKKIYDREIPEIVRVEQQTLNYWFYFTLPALPKDIWEIYQELKKQSRITAKEKSNEIEPETYQERVSREKQERQKKVTEFWEKGFTQDEIAVAVGCASATVRRDLQEIRAYRKVSKTIPLNITNSNSNIYNLSREDKILDKSSDVYNI
jgi:hypothetical protein